METRIFGRTGLPISVLGLGGMSVENLTRKESDHLFNSALDLGISYIDTAPEYLKSEAAIGNAIGKRRNEYILATKCGDYIRGGIWSRLCYLRDQGPKTLSANIRYTRKVFEDNIARSLRLLRTDYIDVMQMHGLMPQYLPGGEQDELVQLLSDYVKKGIIRHIGCTFRNGRPGDPLYPAGYGLECMKAFLDWNVIETVLITYGALTRNSEMVIMKAAEKGFGIAARGIMNTYGTDLDDAFVKAGLDELLSLDESRQGFLLRFVLSHKGVTTAVVGTSNPNNLQRNVEAATRGPLAEAVYAEAARRLARWGSAPDPFPISGNTGIGA